MTAPRTSLQSIFFEHIRQSLPHHVSFVDILSETLEISRDSAYRRIRGETILSLDEVRKLARDFKLSIDAIISPSSDIASFNYKVVNNHDFNFAEWLKTILQNLKMLSNSEKGELLYFAKDMPVFYYFNSPLLSSFKMFFWMSSVLQYQEYHGKQFTPDVVPRELTSLGERIYDYYTTTKRIEIWSEETLNVTLRQIQFYLECGFIGDKSTALKLCDEYAEIVNMVREWAGKGYKDEPQKAFELYKNDLLIADNTILFRMDGKRVVFIPYNTINILSTTNESFCRETDEYLANLIRKSEKISTTGEKPRHAFFNHMQEKIRLMRNKLSLT